MKRIRMETDFLASRKRNYCPIKKYEHDLQYFGIQWWLWHWC